MEKLFNFNFDTEEYKNEIVVKTGGLISPSKNNTKKISYHSKQVSVDFFKLDMNTKNDQLRVNLLGKPNVGTASKLTPTSKLSSGIASFGNQMI